MSMNRRKFIRNTAGIFVPAIVGLSKAASIVPFNPQIRTVVSGGGGGISSPADISNLYAWYKVDAGLLKSGSPVVDGDDATDWQDQSGNARHLVATGTPRYNANIKASKGGLVFGSTDMFRVAFGATVSSACTQFAVVKVVNIGAFEFVSDGDDGTNRHALFQNNSDQISAFAGSDHTSTATVSANAWFIIVGHFNNSSSGKLWINNSMQGLAASNGTNSIDGLTIGNNNSQTLAWTGYIHEFGMYNKALNDTEAGNLTTHLNSRWSVF